MDPDEALRQIRMVTENAHVINWDDRREVAELLRELIADVDALDGWLSRGGFRPRAWVDATSG